MAFVADAPEIDDLNDREVTLHLSKLIRGLSRNVAHLRDVEPEYLRTLYAKMVQALDEADEMNSFGSEGWREFLAP